MGSTYLITTQSKQREMIKLYGFELVNFSLWN